LMKIGDVLTMKDLWGNILAVIVFIYIHILFTQDSCIYMAQFSHMKAEP